jgi:hypothetical protein
MNPSLLKKVVNYTMNQDLTKSVYILLTNTGSLFSTAIGFYTKQRFNHVSIALNDDFKAIYSFGRKHAKNPIVGGFVNEIETQIYEHFESTSCIVLRKTVSAEKYARILESINKFENEKYIYSYNLIGFAGFIVNIPIKRNNAFFCSQFVGEVLKQGGVDFTTKPSELVKPSDFLHHTKFEQVYKGDLIQFLSDPKKHLENQPIEFYL